MIDVWSSKSVRLPRQMIHLNNLALPIDEAVFLHTRPQDSEIQVASTSDRSTSLLAQMIRLNRILMEVNDVIAEAAECDDDTLIVVEHKITSLSYKLHDWHCSLPGSMLDTPENLQQYAAQGLGRIFVAVYLGYYHYGQVLLYQFLHQDQAQTGESERANKCKDFAAKLCDLVYRAHATPGCDVWYNSKSILLDDRITNPSSPHGILTNQDHTNILLLLTVVGHILVIASTIQIHTLLFSTSEIEISSARSRLEQNFQILLRLKEYWPMLESCFARLQILHEVCRTNVDTSFRMDQWMLKFLSEFAEPVRGKGGSEGSIKELDLVDNVGVSPQNWR